ncbi:PAS domain S-box protein [Starkeya sp. ORNL1]|uniref:PAS domain S-box protein n=1 Tax=Starkeya sp. ORNL1 TaxID=2709380 RepID=UPI001FEE6A99|nr:PAS domain S-box protein [Starkeya sp. ORNL1]
MNDIVVEAADIGIFVLDAERRIVKWNAWMATATQKAASDCVGRTLAEVFPESVSPRLQSAISEAFESGSSSLLTQALHSKMLPLRTPAGFELIHNTSIRPLGHRPYSSCLVQIVDVTASVHRERVLRARQDARYRAVVNSALDAILTLDAEGIIQLANPAAAQQFGYSPEELVGRALSPILEDQDEWSEIWHGLLKGDVLTRPIEVIARCKDGSATYLEVTASRWRSDSRTFVTAIFRDANERKAAEAELRGLNLTLELRVAERTADRDRMWRLSTDLMGVLQLDGTINATNPAWTRILGWTECELVGANLADFVVPAQQAELRRILRALGDGTPPEPFVLQLCARDAGARWIEWSAVASEDLLQAVGRDITAEREAEQALLLAEDALRQSQKMEAVGQLTGGIAHDFNNMLTGVIGSIDIVKRRVAAGRFTDLSRFMDAASVSALRAAALTQRLLAFSRRQSLDSKPTNVNVLVGSLEDLLSRTTGESIRLRVELDHDLPFAVVDGNQLESAILNLAINARDAMPDGGDLTVRTRLAELGAADVVATPDMKAGSYIVIAVSDTGVGMSADLLTKVFEPFFTTKPVGHGTGLGLSMVYGFARQSNGQVQIKSQPGAGTSVELYLPVADSQATGDADAVLATHGGSGQRVLVVEDDEAVRMLVREILQELGYTPIEAPEAQAAIRILASPEQIDLMISDVGLPGMNGRQLAEVARQQRPALPILFLTGYAENAAIRSGFLGTNMAMITKPFAIETLSAKIGEMLTTGSLRIVD